MIILIPIIMFMILPIFLILLSFIFCKSIVTPEMERDWTNYCIDENKRLENLARNNPHQYNLEREQTEREKYIRPY